MKIKTDFVTNSSTVVYIISSPKEIDKDILHITPGHALEEYITLKTIEELTEYTQSEKCDWITKITGPYRFWQMNRERYQICKEIIVSGNIAIHMDINNNYTEEMSRVENIFVDRGATILIKEHD